MPVVLPAGEQEKNWNTLNSLFDVCLLAVRAENNADRAGWRCNWRYHRICGSNLFARRTLHPDATTLLAQVDSSVAARPASIIHAVRI